VHRTRLNNRQRDAPNDEKIICHLRLTLIKLKCPVSRRAFSYAGHYRLKARRRPDKVRLIKRLSWEGIEMARVALVTGGTRGIGAAISKALKDAGYKVAASYAGNDTAAEKFKAETGIPVYKWDVSSFEACAAGVKQVEADLGPVDVLINNAGITKDGAFHKMTPEQWNSVINTNLGSLFNMTRQVIEGMRARKFGRVISISSINGQKGQFGQVNYSAAKAGDIGFTKALALENAKGGITVNVICPGYINTEMVQAVPKEVLEKNIIPQIPVNRLGEPEEIARAVVFLAADEAGFITGSTLTVNGGQYHA
jgi:acetoacetyl-CoA reductase